MDSSPGVNVALVDLLDCGEFILAPQLLQYCPPSSFSTPHRSQKVIIFPSLHSLLSFKACLNMLKDFLNQIIGELIQHSMEYSLETTKITTFFLPVLSKLGCF
jgi:hypothetical protein